MCWSWESTFILKPTLIHLAEACHLFQMLHNHLPIKPSPHLPIPADSPAVPPVAAAPELLEDAPLQHRCILWQRCARELLAFRLHRLEGGQKVLLHRVPRRLGGLGWWLWYLYNYIYIYICIYGYIVPRFTTCLFGVAIFKTTHCWHLTLKLLESEGAGKKTVETWWSLVANVNMDIRATP